MEEKNTVDLLTRAELDVHHFHFGLRQIVDFFHECCSLLYITSCPIGERQGISFYRSSHASQPQTAAGETLLKV